MSTSPDGDDAVRPDAVRHDAVTRDAVTHDAERLTELVGDALVGAPRNPALDDARYLDWIADELTEAARHAGRRADRGASDAAFLARGRALRAAVDARRLGVRCVDGAPPARRAAVRGAPGAVVDHARAGGAAPLVDLAVAAGAGRDLWDEPCEQWVALPAGISSDRHLAVRVRGESMAPLMRSGDTVLVRLEGGGAVQVGSVVVARHPDDGYVCKRVRRVEGAVIELDSLAPDGPAFVLPRDDRLVLGTVVMVWRGR